MKLFGRKNGQKKHNESVSNKNCKIKQCIIMDGAEAEEKYFDIALDAIKNGNYSDAEEIISEYHNTQDQKQSNRVVSIKAHMNIDTYNYFFKYKIAWPDTVEISDAEIKSLVILYHLYGMRTESAVKHLKERTGTDIDFLTMHKAMRIIQSIDDIIEGKELSEAIKKGQSGMKVFYKIRSMNDGAVCEHCRELNGNELLFEDAIIGVNYPPFDFCKSEYCRCVAISKMK